MDTQGESYGKTGRYWRDGISSQRMTDIASNYSFLGERHGADSPSEPHPDFKLSACKTVEEYISVMLSHIVRQSVLSRLISLGSPRRTKGSGALEEETGVRNSQGGEKDNLPTPHLFFSSTFLGLQFSSVQFSSLSQSCLTLCDLMNLSTPGLPVHHDLPEFTQTHVNRVRVAIQPSHPRSSPSPTAPNPSQHHSLFQ